MQHIIIIILYIISSISVIYAGQHNNDSKELKNLPHNNTVKRANKKQDKQSIIVKNNANASSKLTEQTPEALEYNINNAVDNYLNQHFLNASFMFTHNKNIIAMGARGIASSKGRQLTANQKMPVVEDLQLLIATAILKLQDTGKLKVYDRLNKYFPVKGAIWKSGVAPDWIDKISIHHLLTHSSGLAEYVGKIKTDMHSTDARIEVVNYAAIKPLEFKPGKSSSYSNTNFTLLELIIEKITGKSLAVFLQTEFLLPLKMHSSKIISASEMLYGLEHELYPSNYEVQTINAIKPSYTPIKFDNIAFTNILVSNNRDLLKFYRALHEGKILSQESYQAMTLKHFQLHNESGRKKYIGYGLYITKLKNDEVMYYCSGKLLGVRSELGYIPNNSLYFSILSNIAEKLPKNTNINDSKNQLDIIYFRNAVLKSLY